MMALVFGIMLAQADVTTTTLPAPSPTCVRDVLDEYARTHGGKEPIGAERAKLMVPCHRR